MKLMTLAELSADLAGGRTTSRELVEWALARIEDPSGEGARTFITVDREAALLDAGTQDKLRARGVSATPFAGIPIAVKDLFDVAGQVTTAGSTILQGTAPASTDCPAIARLRAAGFVLIGRTNMVEFAFGGIGTNPHYGTPRSTYDRAVGRVPGGSSSGSAVAVADGMAVIGMGTDTGGSCRIPAAFNAITGYKPTAHRVPRTGVTPLSTTLDSIGPLGPSVACCAAVDAILARDWSGEIAARPLKGLRLGVLQTQVMADLSDQVASAYANAIDRLSAAGCQVADVDIDALDELPEINAKGGIVAAEAWAFHRQHLSAHGESYDPRVAIRMMRGAKQSAADYIETCNARARLITNAHDISRSFDALVMPSVAIIPPKLSELEQDEDYVRLNMLSVRNTTIGNFLDRCAISLPISEPGAAPVGLMLLGEHGADQQLFSVAAAVEAILALACSHN